MVLFIASTLWALADVIFFLVASSGYSASSNAMSTIDWAYSWNFARTASSEQWFWIPIITSLINSLSKATYLSGSLGSWICEATSVWFVCFLFCWFQKKKEKRKKKKEKRKEEGGKTFHWSVFNVEEHIPPFIKVLESWVGYPSNKARAIKIKWRNVHSFERFVSGLENVIKKEKVTKLAYCPHWPNWYKEMLFSWIREGVGKPKSRQPERSWRRLQMGAHIPRKLFAVASAKLIWHQFDCYFSFSLFLFSLFSFLFSFSQFWKGSSNVTRFAVFVGFVACAKWLFEKNRKGTIE